MLLSELMEALQKAQAQQILSQEQARLSQEQATRTEAALLAATELLRQASLAMPQQAPPTQDTGDAAVLQQLRQDYADLYNFTKTAGEERAAQRQTLIALQARNLELEQENATLQSWSLPQGTADQLSSITIDYGGTDSRMTTEPEQSSKALGIIQSPVTALVSVPDFSLATGDFTSGDYTNGARLYSEYATEQANARQLTEGTLPPSLRHGAGTTMAEELLPTPGLGDPPP